MKNAVIYARYSPGSKQNYQSIEGQLKECYAFAERSDLRVVREYVDEHLTGTNDKRTQFLQMIEDSKRKGFQYIYLGKYIFQGNEIDGGMPRIIDDELFDEVQRVLEKYAQAPSRGKALEEYLLSEKLICGKCSNKMTGISGTSKNKEMYF
jgi:hypothetical protein